MERIDHLLFSFACGLAMGVFWGGVVALLHVKTGLCVGLAMGLFTFGFLAKMYKEWWAEEADLGVAPQEGKAV
jgi:hypothetical protein